MTLLRYGAATVADGRATLPTPTSSTIVAGFYPASGAQLQRLPELLRARVSATAFCETELLTADQATGRVADRLVVDGATYEVQSSVKWPSAGPLPHWESALARLDETGGDP
jgi:hypothetical protein